MLLSSTAPGHRHLGLGEMTKARNQMLLWPVVEIFRRPWLPLTSCVSICPIKIRVINVVDLMVLQPPSEHPHGISDKDEGIFTPDKPIVFAFHVPG